MGQSRLDKIEICSMPCNNHCLSKMFARMSVCGRQEVCAGTLHTVIKGRLHVHVRGVNNCAHYVCVSAHLGARFFVFFNVL